MLDKLEYVLAIASEQNMRRASEKLCLSQPALTASINRLEEELGVTLFDRSCRPIRLTEAGECYIRGMRKLRRVELELRAELKTLAEKEGTFTLGIGTGRALHWVPKILPAFHVIHPNVKFQVCNGTWEELMDRLSDGTIDAAIGTLNTSSAEIQQKTLLRENLIYVVPRNLMLFSLTSTKGILCSIL